ncbi:MAG: PIN domain-containing protein [Flavobacteriales bacterium]|nr:PIN domain-containing protein [Flavobacteriales bacterium]
MKLFLDANILVAVLNKEYPLFDTAARVLSLSSRRGITLCTSPICLAIAFYFSEKKSGAKMAKSRISLLTDHIQIAESTGTTVQKALNNPKVLNLEDGLEYYAAIRARCTHIITEDVDDFHFSEIAVMRSKELLMSLGK